MRRAVTLRTMLGLAIGAIAIGLPGTSGVGGAPAAPAPAATTRAAPAPAAVAGGWACPMNCVPPAPRAGNCSVCGMRLVAAASIPPPHPREEQPPRVAAFVCERGDGTEDVAAGACPACGAAMVPVSRPLSAAILVFDGVQIIDYCGPAEVFGQGRVQPHIVARTTDTVTTAMGMKVVPSYSFADCPPTEVLIIPGGSVGRVEEDSVSIAWLRERGRQAQFVLSVCNGAFILARTGLIDGLTATTFYDLIDDFEARYPAVKAIRDQRYVDNGKFITTAGISSGIDGSLHVIGKLRGLAMAQRAALNMEYEWKPDASYARAAFADRHLRRIFDRNLRLRIQEGVSPLVVSTRGDRDRWDVEWRIASDEAPAALMARLDSTVALRGPWRAAAPGPRARGAGPAVRSAWRFDADGEPWSALTEIAPEATPGRYRVRVRVERGPGASRAGRDL